MSVFAPGLGSVEVRAVRSLIGIFAFFIAMTSAFADGQASFIFGRGPQDSLAASDLGALYQLKLNEEMYDARNQGFSELTRGWGADDYRGLRIFIKKRSLQTKFNRRYLAALESSKHKIMKIYGLKNDEYNRLALMAFGILGRETKFGTSARYFLKENMQPVVTAVKQAEAVLEQRPMTAVNSRGATQIKKVPALIQKHFGIQTAHLDRPDSAAIATIGFLADCLKEMKTRIRHRNPLSMNESNIYDYILYSYFGSIRQIVRGTATPERNLYIQAVKKHISNLILFESMADSSDYVFVRIR